MGPRHCIVCDLPPRASYRLHNGATLLRCPRCGLGWWHWPAFDAGAFYDQDYFQSAGAAKGYDDYESLEPGNRRTARGRLARLQHWVTQEPRSLLDFGCSTGVFLDEARQRGWNVAGIEVSAYAAEQARRRGLDVACGTTEQLEATDATFECVTLWDVIEHLPDPGRALRAAARIVRPGGVLALSTGDVASLCARLCGPRWHLFNLPEHLFFFTPAALRGLLQQAGFVTRQIVREVNWVPVGYLSERLRKTSGPIGRLLRFGPCLWLTRRTQNWVLPATLRDVVGVYAVREAPRATSTGSSNR